MELSVTNSNGIIILNFPAWEAKPVDIQPVLVEGLGIRPLATFLSRDLLALFNSQEEIVTIKPRFELLSGVSEHGIIITAPGKNCDFVSRFFAPAMGINEDPVTGSAHSTLIPFWFNKLNKVEMHTFQLSERTGELFCKYLGDRVEIGGRAITYLQGHIYL